MRKVIRSFKIQSKKVFQQANNKTVAAIVRRVSEFTNQDATLFGILLVAKDSTQWLREEYPINFYLTYPDVLFLLYNNNNK